MWMIVGLGNPGEAYSKTRHNIGFLCVSHFGRRHGLPIQKEQAHALVGEGSVYGRKVVLVKPMTYMNRSGLAVAELCRRYQVDPSEQLLVVYDDMDLPFGKLRLRFQGSAGTHNGMKSLVAQLATQRFPRLRVGVGGKPVEQDACSYILGTFRPEEQAVLPALCSLVSDAIDTIVRDGIEVAMNRYNGLSIPPRSSEAPTRAAGQSRSAEDVPENPRRNFPENFSRG